MGLLFFGLQASEHPIGLTRATTVTYKRLSPWVIAFVQVAVNTFSFQGGETGVLHP